MVAHGSGEVWRKKLLAYHWIAVWHVGAEAKHSCYLFINWVSVTLRLGMLC